MDNHIKQLSDALNMCCGTCVSKAETFALINIVLRMTYLQGFLDGVYKKDGEAPQLEIV